MATPPRPPWAVPTLGDLAYSIIRFSKETVGEGYFCFATVYLQRILVGVAVAQLPYFRALQQGTACSETEQICSQVISSHSNPRGNRRHHMTALRSRGRQNEPCLQTALWSITIFDLQRLQKSMTPTAKFLAHDMMMISKLSDKVGYRYCERSRPKSSTSSLRGFPGKMRNARSASLLLLYPPGH
jgi:hypothetical protein